MDTFTLPTAAEIITGIKDYSGSMFTEYLPIVFLVIGLVAAALALRWLGAKGSGFFGALLRGKGKGRRSGNIHYTYDKGGRLTGGWKR